MTPRLVGIWEVVLVVAGGLITALGAFMIQVTAIAKGVAAAAGLRRRALHPDPSNQIFTCLQRRWRR